MSVPHLPSAHPMSTKQNEYAIAGSSTLELLSEDSRDGLHHAIVWGGAQIRIDVIAIFPFGNNWSNCRPDDS
jgi:hypothetical protein